MLKEVKEVIRLQYLNYRLHDLLKEVKEVIKLQYLNYYLLKVEDLNCHYMTNRIMVLLLIRQVRNLKHDIPLLELDLIHLAKRIMVVLLIILQQERELEPIPLLVFDFRNYRLLVIIEELLN